MVGQDSHSDFKSAWRTLIEADPAVVDDPQLGWFDRLALDVLSPDKGMAYLQGTSAADLTMPDGRSLAEYPETRLSRASGEYFALASPCPLFSDLEIDSGRAVSVRVRESAFRKEEAPKSGCGIPHNATAAMIRLRVDTPDGERPRLKVWAEDLPEPLRGVFEPGSAYSEVEAATTVLGLCTRCEIGDLRLRSSHETRASALVLGYFAPRIVIGGRFRSGGDPGDAGLLIEALTEAPDETAVGVGALAANLGSDNSAFGVDALGDNTTGSLNTAVGDSALELNTTGDDNTAVGAFALDANTTGDGNTAIGRSSLGDNTTGGTSIPPSVKPLWPTILRGPGTLPSARRR